MYILCTISGPVKRAIANGVKRVVIILTSTILFRTRINSDSIDWSDIINIFSLLAESDFDWEDFDLGEVLDSLEFD